MIIDEILDRKHGFPFNAKDFEEYVLHQAKRFNFKWFDGVFNEADKQRREDLVKRAIILYLVYEDYKLENISYVLSVNWT